jgi:2OG-Fe(II) oxygenase superfamily
VAVVTIQVLFFNFFFETIIKKGRKKLPLFTGCTCTSYCSRRYELLVNTVYGGTGESIRYPVLQMKLRRMTTINRILFVCIVAVLSLRHVTCNVSGRGNSRKISILNQSGRSVEIYWIHPNTGEGVLMTSPSLVNGAEFPLDSFVGHAFEAREVPSKKTGQCGMSNSSDDSGPGVCRRAPFEVSANDDQVAKITNDFQAIFVDNRIKAMNEATDIVATCQAGAKQRLLDADIDKVKAEQAVEDLINCVEGGVATALVKVHEEIAFQSDIRKKIAASLENYTCTDDSLNSTTDLRTENWIHQKDNSKYIVHINHERPASRIHVIDNFIREDECIAMEEHAAASLHRATVADGKGGSRLSENRKAMQAGIKVDWGDEINDNPIARVSRRIYDYTNHVLGLNIQEHGQEDLMSIQYFGRGRNDTEPDRYTPHCDGDCTGLPHKHGTRMATMVLYCKVADAGGHTNFRNAGVHVKPQKYAGIFFSYIDPATKTMDTGFTEHSGCPVYEGSKKIVTQWMRLGVDKENPWSSFNTLGVKRTEEDIF